MRSEHYKESDFSSMHFEVRSIDGSDLICQFTATSVKLEEPIVKQMRVTVRATEHQLALSIKD